jgi:pimeloyl-ACP methyl ester carboxylesterase
LIVPSGEFRLFAFADVNRNGVFDTGEPAGEYGNGAVVAAPGAGVVAALDFALAANPNPRPGIANGTAFRNAPSAPPSTQAGALADLDAPAFSAQNGERGYWAPMAFFRETGGNIVFVEPYDPARTPILFVHGAAGSAQDWRHFIENIDRSRYQPWIFQYPSGAAVESMAYLMYWKLLNLQIEHHFEKLYITAHSMGGLVARAFLVNHGSLLPQVKLFVSLSTPWAGEASADLGVKHSPAVVPSWHDMQPEGRFMQSLFARPLPSGVEYYLLFGHRGGYSMLRPNNDGTVTLASQLRSSAQADAKMVFGFDEDHVSILASSQVLAQYRAILDGLEKRATGTPRPGQVRVAFSFDAGDDPGDDPTGLPQLLLTPVEGAAQEPRSAVSLALAAGDSGRTVGPVPAGAYDASLVAMAFRTEPAIQRVQVAADTTPALHFHLVPQGALSGYIGADLGVHDGPAGSFRRPHPSVKVTAITLRSGTTQRRLVPRRAGPDNLIESYLRGEDDAYQAGFSFVGLPAGEYELTIEAEGHRSHTSRHAIVPGRPRALMPIALEPLR